MTKKKSMIIIIIIILLVAGLIGWQHFQRGNSSIFKQSTMSDIRVSIVYESVIDQTRDANNVANIVNETYVGYLHRSFFRWRGFAEIEREYDVYGILESAIMVIKEKNPNVIFGGAVAAQEINSVEYDPLTEEIIPKEKTWAMALDPQKYGFNMTKEELHEIYWEKTGSTEYILPDITNPDFQKLFLDFIKKQIDVGIDAIWIDGLLVQAGIFARLINNITNTAITKSFEAASDIVDEIHNYGESKGKYIYVGSWSNEYWYAYGMSREYYSKLDFVTMSPSADEIKNKTLNEEKWQEKIGLTKEVYGNNITIIAFIDWAFTKDTPLGTFSQTLSKEEQREVLRNFDNFFVEKGIVFVFPVHGGFMGRDATILSFGNSGKYDALAPEFDTYGTIKELAREKVIEGVENNFNFKLQTLSRLQNSWKNINIITANENSLKRMKTDQAISKFTKCISQSFA